MAGGDTGGRRPGDGCVFIKRCGTILTADMGLGLDDGPRGGGFRSPSSSPEHHISLLWVLTFTSSGRTSEHGPEAVVWGGGLPPQLCKAPSICPTAPPYMVLQGN